MKNFMPSMLERYKKAIKEILPSVSVEIIEVTKVLPKTMAGNHIGKQILRFATSVGANYEEARSAESRADFAHKLSVSLKELRETSFWLKILVRGKMIDRQKSEELLKECDELISILVKSVITAKKNRTGGKS